MPHVVLGTDVWGRRILATLDGAGRVLGLGIEEVPQPTEGQPGDGYPVPPDVLARPRLSTVSESVRYAEGGAAATAAGPAAAPPIQVPPHLAPPYGAFPLDVPAVRIPQTVPLAGSLIVALDTPPPGQITVLWTFGLSTTDLAGTRLTVRVNRQPVPPLAGIVGVIGDLTRPTRLAAPILVPASQEADVLIENIGTAAITVAVRAQGWRYAMGT